MEDNPVMRECLSACRFEGEKANRYEMADLPVERVFIPTSVPPDCEVMDLPVVEIPPAPNEFRVAKKLSNIDAATSVVSGKNVVEREADNRDEIADLPIAYKFLAPIFEFPVAKTSDLPDCALQTMCGCVKVSLRVVNLSVCCEKSSEGVETHYDADAVMFVVDRRIKSLCPAGSYENGQKVIMGMHGMGWLTLDEVVHLERPPGCVFEELVGDVLISIVEVQVVHHVSCVSRGIVDLPF